MQAQKSWFFSVSLMLISSLVFAAGELPPKFKYEDDISRFIGSVQRQLPFANSNNRGLTDIQRLGVEYLTKNFPEYRKQMAAKPGPYNFEIFEVEVQKEQTYVLEEPRYKEVLSQVFSSFNKDLNSFPRGLSIGKKLAAIENQELAKLKQTLSLSSDSVRGILTGLAQILPNEEKGSFFKLGDPNLQINYLANYLSEKNLTDEVLKTSKFRAETVGLTSETITIEKVLSIARARLQGSRTVFQSLSYLQFIRKLKSQLKPLGEVIKESALATPAQLSKILTPTDFDFAIRNGDAFVTEIILAIGGTDEKNQTQIRQQLEAFQNSFSRLSFKVRTTDITNRKKIGMLFEVHPYLGIHRGCIGGDCSTSNSPMFPYSPWEHIFYIQDANGRFVGYISATRVIINRQPTFYIKDITGPNLSPDLAEACLYTLNEAISKYGAKKFAVASPGFTDRQNSNIPIRHMLSQYNQASEPVPLYFPDKEIREAIANTRKIFASTPTYDSPQVHSTGVVFTAIPSRAEHFVSVARRGTLPKGDSKESLAELMEEIKPLVNTLTLVEPSNGKIAASVLREARELFANKRQQSISNYYSSIQSYLVSFETELDAAFIKKYESHFYLGHILASDAFNPRLKKSLLAKSFLYFSELLIQQKVSGSLLSLYREHADLLEANNLFQEGMKILSERLDPRDVLLLTAFTDAGSPTAKSILKKTKNQEKVEATILQIIENGVLELGFTNQDVHLLRGTAFYPQTLAVQFHSAANGTAKQFAESLQRNLQAFQIDWRNIKNPLLRNKIQSAFLATTDATDPEYRKATLQILSESVKSNSISNAAFSLTVFRLQKANSKISEIVNDRIEFLASHPTFTNMLEIYGYKMMGYTAANEAVTSEKLKGVRLAVLEQILASDAFFKPEDQAMYTALRLYKDPKFLSLFELRSIYNERFQSADVAFARYQSVMESFGATAQDLFKMKSTGLTIANIWWNTNGAYSSANPDVIKASLALVENIVRTTPNPQFLHYFLANIEFIKQKSSYHNLVQVLANDLGSENCAGCGQFLVSLIAEKHTDGKWKLSSDAVRKLLDSNVYGVRTFGLAVAIEQGYKDLVTEEILMYTVANYDNFNLERSSTGRVTLANRFLSALTKLKNAPPRFLDRLLTIARTEGVDEIAVKAAVTFARLGGDRQLALHELHRTHKRWEMSFKISSEAKEYLRELEGRAKDAPSRLVSCDQVLYVR